MKICHMTTKLDAQNIMKSGLTYRFRDKEYSATEMINYELEKYRPSHLPAFIDRGKCVFFHFDCVGRTNSYSSIIVVDPVTLDQDKLYIADIRFAHHLFDNRFDYDEQELATSYWNSLVPFSEFDSSIHMKNKYEVLYFGEISHKLLTHYPGSTALEEMIVDPLKQIFKQLTITGYTLEVLSEHSISLTNNENKKEKYILTFDEKQQTLKVKFKKRYFSDSILTLFEHFDFTVQKIMIS